MIMLITGTPGVGKSLVSSKLREIFKCEYLNVSRFVVERKLYTEFDEISQSYVIDEEKVKEELRKFLEKQTNVIIETIYPSLIPKADLVVVLRRNPLKLYRELKDRSWSELKIAENVEAEILGVTAEEAKQNFENVCEIDTTNNNVEQIVNKIINKVCDRDVDWLNNSEVQDLLINLDNIISSHENNI
ncbi:NMP kinase [Sulfolobus sp. C3]|nr:NMP kinase [Sulfolobus sp. C3]